MQGGGIVPSRLLVDFLEAIGGLLWERGCWTREAFGLIHLEMFALQITHVTYHLLLVTPQIHSFQWMDYRGERESHFCTTKNQNNEDSAPQQTRWRVSANGYMLMLGARQNGKSKERQKSSSLTANVMVKCQFNLVLLFLHTVVFCTKFSCQKLVSILFKVMQLEQG